MPLNKKNQKGQSVIELLVAMSVFVLVVSSIMFLVMDATLANRQGTERAKAALVSHEGMEAALSIANRGWRYLENGDHGIDDSSGYWDWLGNSNIIDKYTRKITVEPVYRDGSGDITTTGGTIDFDTKKVISKVNWDFTTARPSEVILESYFTNWQSLKWLQTTQAEFDLGTKDQVVSTATEDGELELDQMGGVGSSYEWPFDVPANYIYDSDKIEVATSQAQLKSQGAVVASGSTANPGFDADYAPEWTYSDWDYQDGEANPDGTWQSAGGNPGGYAQVEIPAGKKDQVGGFFQQSFDVTDVPTTAYTQFDYQVASYTGLPQQLQAYIFVDSTPGEPVVGTEVWTSGLLTSTTPWISIGPIDIISSLVSTPDTYYLKLAVWVRTGGKSAGPFSVGFDNALAYWETVGVGGSYPTDNPPIQPTASFEPVDLLSWTSFQETATKNGGEIYYQLSDDDGTTWQYWDGSIWAFAGATDYNPATVINTNITSFSVTNEKMMFKAFLSSDGTQQVMLDMVRVTYDEISAFNSVFDNPGDYSYDAGKIEIVSSNAQLVGTGGGSSGGTSNPGFDTDFVPEWQYSDWDRQGGEVKVNGSWVAAGGNPGGYANIGIPAGRNDEVGGFFEQSFTVTENNSETAYVSFDMAVMDFNGSPQSLQAYVFVDSAPGEPVVGTEVWTSGSVAGTTSWTSYGPIDITSIVSSSGTYYLKLAVWVTTTSRAGRFDIGFDNALAYWEKTGAGYPSDNPPIQPTASFEPADVTSWNSFQETATKNGGEIFYQLSDDDGTTWQYWNGAIWTTAGAADYNIASVVNTNITSFPVTNKKLMFNAFLSSDGTQQVRLDNVQIEYSVSGGAGYFLTGTFESSAFDTGAVSPVYNYINWTTDEPVGTRIEWQLRTADTEANLLAATWVGPDGTSGTFYTSPGELIELDPGASGARWVQYKAYFYSDGTSTPILKDVTLDYEP